MEQRCEEQISGESVVRGGRVAERTQDCALTAAEWCATCRMNVCDQHVTAHHLLHSRTALPLTAEPAEDHGERRSGVERRQSDEPSTDRRSHE